MNCERCGAPTSRGLPRIQERVAEFVRGNSLEISVEHRLLDLVSEAGELAKEVLQDSSYGSRPFTSTSAWADEIGDVLFSLACLANSTSVDMEQALDRVLRKLDERIAKKGHAGSER